jgi:hypothetical protein
MNKEKKIYMDIDNNNENNKKEEIKKN